MPLETYLLDGEEILTQAGDFYASNKRLIRYRKGLLGEEWDDIPYAHLSSIGLAKNRRRGWIWGGLSIIGLAITILFTLVTISPIMQTLSSFLGGSMQVNLGPFINLNFMLFGMGLVILLVGVFMQDVYIEFRAPGLNKDTEAKFRLRGVRREATLNLVRTVREKSLPPNESETAYVQPK